MGSVVVADNCDVARYRKSELLGYAQHLQRDIVCPAENGFGALAGLQQVARRHLYVTGVLRGKHHADLPGKAHSFIAAR